MVFLEILEMSTMITMPEIDPQMVNRTVGGWNANPLFWKPHFKVVQATHMVIWTIGAACQELTLVGGFA